MHNDNPREGAYRISAILINIIILVAICLFFFIAGIFLFDAIGPPSLN
jgi:hypothetical protein